jgi:putative flippase GtrA
MTPPSDPASSLPRGRTRAATGLGFVASGLMALLVDMGVLSILTRLVGFSALVARPVGIALAMVVGWLAHRQLTFAVTQPPTLAEFARYAALAWGVAALNYAVFTLGLIALPDAIPEAVLAVASAVAMVASYIGMRYGVFPTTR